MRRTARLLRWLLLLLLLLLVITAGGGWIFARRSLPQTSGTVRVAGINAPVEIARDVDAIPHIRAQTRLDAFYGLGYVHAQDRLWQMEFQRRIGSGSLSEALGPSTINTDRFLRTLGVYRAATSAWETLSPQSREVVEAYIAGINQFIDTHSGSQLPPEFTILGVEPEPWTGPDVLVWQKMMAWDLGDNWSIELLRNDIVRAVGPERMQALLPGYPEDGSSVVGSVANSDYTSLLALGDDVRALLDAGGVRDGLGSNNWVVAGSKSTTGFPILADDPHLGTRIPSIWYLAHLASGDFNVIGATFPGLPSVVIGRNERIAWGVTNVGPDVQDLYRERLDPSGTMAEYEGQMEPLQIISDTIRVKGGEDVPLLVRISRHGPLISDAVNANNANDTKLEDKRPPALEPLAFRWTALDPDDSTMDAFLGINEARNWDEFRAALQSYVAPAQNFVYGDVDGNIGYYAPGHYPIRAAGDGSMPVEGWTSDNEWTGWVPFDDLPQRYNPPEGFIATANNRPVPAEYPYFLGRDWAQPYRYDRIHEMLTAKDKLSPDDIAAIQADTVSLQARELLPLLLPLITPESDRERAAYDVLRGWDYNTRGDSTAAAIYQAWLLHLPRGIAGDELGAALTERYEFHFNFWTRFLATSLSDSQSAWCNDATTPQIEDCAAIANATFRDALDEVAQRQGDDVASWRWDRMHTVVFPHQPFDSVPSLRRFFNRSMPNGGDRSTVNVAPFSFSAPFEQRTVPGYRHIVDLSSADGGRFIHAGGQSGHPLSPHYDSYLDDWQAVRYRPMRFTTQAIDGGQAETLRLEPE